jgi:hypothetical protein
MKRFLNEASVSITQSESVLKTLHRKTKPQLFLLLTCNTGGLSSLLAVSQPSAMDLGLPTPTEITRITDVAHDLILSVRRMPVSLNYRACGPEHHYTNY